MPTHSERICSIPSATGGIARLACARLREFGKDADAIIAKVGAKATQVNDDTVRLEVAKQIKILELVAEELQDPLLGFHLARTFDLREIGLVYYVMTSSESLTDALLNGKRYCAIANQGICIDVRQEDRSTAIVFNYVNVDRRSDRHQEFWLVTTMRICRQATDTRLAPRTVRMKHSRAEIPPEFKTFFGCDVEFGADCDEIIFPVGDGERIDALLFPPHPLVAAPVQLMVMQPAQRHGEAVAHLTPRHPAFRELDMVGIRRHPAAEETGLAGHELQMNAVAIACRLAQHHDFVGGGSGHLLVAIPFNGPSLALRIVKPVVR
jgi:hypothetical protein